MRRLLSPLLGLGSLLRPLELRLVAHRGQRMRMIVTVFEPQIVDKSLNRLFNYVYDKFVELRPL